MTADMNDAAFVSMPSHFVRNGNGLAHGRGGSERDQSAVSVHHQRAGIFGKILIVQFASDGHRHAEEHAHAAAPTGVGDPRFLFVLRQS